jgi:hypothetical protein
MKRNILLLMSVSLLLLNGYCNNNPNDKEPEPDPVPILKVDGELDFSYKLSEKTVTIENIGNGILTFNINYYPTWLLIDTVTGSVDSVAKVIIVSIDRTKLIEGFYNDSLTISSNGGNSVLYISTRQLPSFKCNLIDSLESNQSGSVTLSSDSICLSPYFKEFFVFGNYNLPSSSQQVQIKSDFISPEQSQIGWWFFWDNDESSYITDWIEGASVSGIGVHFNSQKEMYFTFYNTNPNGLQGDGVYQLNDPLIVDSLAELIFEIRAAQLRVHTIDDTLLFLQLTQAPAVTKVACVTDAAVCIPKFHYCVLTDKMVNNKTSQTNVFDNISNIKYLGK